jgi:putative PIN family toxin of toxin-antitoxin system
VRVFLDTNVLVAAFATRGLCADVLRQVLAVHELVTGEVVLMELQEVLSRKIGLPQQAIDNIVSLLRRHRIQPKPKKKPAVAVRDPDDLWILASALAARVDVLVTGDQDLLAVRDQAGILITDPRGFWEMSKERRKKKK